MPEDMQAPLPDTVQETEATIAKRGPGRPPKVRGESLAVAQFQEAFRAESQALILEALGEVRRALRAGKMSGAQAAMAAGILQDKLAAMGAKSGPQSVHLHLHGGDRKELLASVLGNAATRLGSAKRDSVSIDKRDPFSTARPPARHLPGPVIDAVAVPAPIPPAVDSKSPDNP